MQPVTVHGKASVGSQARNGRNSGARDEEVFLLIWAGHSKMLVLVLFSLVC
jgi:hypothetical protein